MKLTKEIFREYDIRGIYNQEFDEEIAYLIGKAYGTKLRSYGKNKTVVAYDNRLSSPSLEENLVKGVLETGVDVLRLGLATTPMCYFAANYYGTDASMMITASHNPKEYNGFKFSYNGIHNAYGESVKEIYEIIEKGEFASGKGEIINKNIEEAYINLITKKLTFGSRKIKVVYDCGNGTTSIMWKYLYDKVDNKACLFDVKCSKSLEDELIKLGVKPVEYRTGNSYTRAASAEGDYPLSGELSGHVYFRDKFPGYDDGIYAGMRLIELLTHIDKPLSSLLDDVNKYYSTPEMKVKTTDDKKFLIINKIKEYCENKEYNILTIDGVKAKFSDGFALVRASNTGPNITMRFEATTEKRLEELKEEFTTELNKYLDK